jgi:ribonuclease-3
MTSVPGATMRAMSRTKASEELQRRLGYRFGDPALLDLAMTHRSWANEQQVEGHYERVEFLGDAVLGLLVAHWLYQRYPDSAEGELSKLKSLLVSEPVLARWADDLSLGKVLRLGVGEARSGGRRKPSLLADALEAVLGAVFLDGGLSAVERIVGDWLVTDPASDLGDFPHADAKTALQELVQARGLDLPVYRHVSEAGPDHRKQFYVECWLGEKCVGEGFGGTKKKAEQRAATRALAAMQTD